MAKNDFAANFKAHPKAEKLYVVNGMPFLEEFRAQNFQRSQPGSEIEIVTRPGATVIEPETDPAKMTKAQLVVELESASIDYPNNAKKPDLLALLVGSGEEE
jgi:hypothetical protein